MLSENIILQSAGSLSVAVMALLMLILQALFFFRKPQFTWYAWSAAIAFSVLLYSVGIFLEYNTLPGPLNRFSGLLEYTAIICLIHCLYGFTFSYLGIESKRYHPVAGVCHGLILILLWFTNYVVAESFITRNFIGLESPYIEPALGPLGPVFVLYAAIAGVYAMIIWIKHKGTDPKHRIVFLVGMGFWFLLGIHDGLASLGVPTFQYVMEYGFLGFAMVVLWVVFSNYLEIAAEEKYRVITEFANDCILVIQDGKMVFRNPACCALIGGPLTDSGTRDFLDIMLSEDRKTVLEHYNTLLEDGHTPNPHTVRIRGADGERRFVEIASSVIQYRNRPAVLAVMRDITERKRAEEVLRDVERRNQALLDHSPVCHKMVDLDFNLTYMSTNGYKMLQLDDNADVYGKPYPFEFFPAAFRNEMTENLKKVKETGDTITMEALANDIEGNEVWLHSTLLPVLDDDGRIDYITVVSANTTQRKRAEEEKAELESQLHRAQKMEAMGLMAGGVAHDLNNILSGIVSYPELLLMDIPVNSPMRKPMETIMESGMRAADVVTDLMTIARGVATSKEVLNFNPVVEKYLNSTEHKNLVSIRPSVTFKTQVDSDLLNVNGSTTHIKKTLMNLVINASEAIEGSGTVTISTMNQYLDEPLRGYEDVVTGEYVILMVSDDGLGISKQDLERIFEPFYTKKVMDRSGTGLGLAVVWNTVQDHKGYINVKSSEKGTVFELYFPVTRKEVAAEKEEVPPEDYLGHGEKILVVDDEERQREIAGGILTRLGYNAETVSSGEEAIEYVKENSVDLIVLDMVMPKGINGRKTYEEIIKIHPGQKAIIASGYAKTKEVDKAQELGAGKYIKKPYTLAKVGLAVKEELEK